MGKQQDALECLNDGMRTMEYEFGCIDGTGTDGQGYHILLLPVQRGQISVLEAWHS